MSTPLKNKTKNKTMEIHLGTQGGACLPRKRRLTGFALGIRFGIGISSMASPASPSASHSMASGSSSMIGP